jgi:superfamily II DNA or RNA helicase
MIEHNNLREWQKQAWIKWEANGCTGIYLGCTGSGKSIAAMYCVQEKKVRTIIVVPTIALMHQWREEISQHFELDLDEIGWIGDGRKDTKEITVAVVNSVRNMDLSQFDMIVLDEAHRYGSFENIRPIMQNEFKYKLGLTATLKRSDGQEKELEKLIGPIVYEYTTEDAVKQGVLSKFEIINVGIDLLPSEYDKYDRHTKTIDANSFAGMYQAVYDQGHQKWHEAVAAVRATAWRKAIISNAKNKMSALVDIVKENKNKKIIIFNETIKMAELERKLLKKEGFESEIYHSKKKNQEAIEKFRTGEVKILVSVKSLNEGLDVKDVDVGIRVAGTNQDRDTIQRLGRGLRVVEGKDSAKYYQIYCKDTIEKWQITKNTNTIRSAAEKVTWK